MNKVTPGGGVADTLEPQPCIEGGYDKFGTS